MEQMIQQIIRETNPAANPYFISLEDKSFDFEDFIETQIQFYFAVVFFSRPMCTLAAKIPETKLRVEVIRNAWEEHGEGDPNNIHGHTFTTLLHRLGVASMDDIAKRALWPETRRFNTTLIGCCTLDEYLVGASLLGMIEHMFSDISGRIGKCIVDNGWLAEDQLIHYTLHQELDIKHADDFFNVVKPAMNESEENHYMVEQGLRLGAFTFNSFYQDLYDARKKRISRSVRCNHSRA